MGRLDRTRTEARGLAGMLDPLRGPGWRILVANLAGAVIVYGYETLLPHYESTGWDVRGHVLVDVAVFVAYCGVVGGACLLRGYRHFANATQPLTEARPLSEAEIGRILRLPSWSSLLTLAIWGGAVLLWGTLAWVAGAGLAATVRIAVAIVLGGLVTGALVFLLVERWLRPVFAEALDGAAPRHTATLGVRPKLTLSWALGSGVPLLAIALSPIGLPADARAELAALLPILAVLGIGVGGLLIVTAARSVSDPLEALRAGMTRVEAGDLESEIAVDDGGEVGMLQRGFNRMTGGLRERRALEDIFGRQVGVDVARRALERGVVLGGERRPVTVLFVDITGSSALPEAVPPERVVELLNAFFGVVVGVVTAEGGWVDKFEGDGALCVFGVPVEQADHAARGLRAARTLRRELLTLAVAHPELDAGIGVSSGSVVAGNVGTEERFEYTVIGRPVNQAVRLTGEAKRRLGRALASEETVQRAASDAHGWTVAGEVSLRGQSDTTLVYEPSDTEARTRRSRGSPERDPA